MTGIPLSKAEAISLHVCEQDSLDKQILFNGRVWRNLYSNVRGDQFLFSGDFLKGTVTVNGKTYYNMNVKYDIYNDEILITTDRGIILQLNKEMTDEFAFEFNNREFVFRKMEPDVTTPLTGYVNNLVDGNLSLLVKYKKEIDPLSVENKYDSFGQSHRVYVRKDGKIYPINFRKDFFNVLSDNKQQIRDFIKRERVRMTRKNPESYIPVTVFYNSLQR